MSRWEGLEEMVDGLDRMARTVDQTTDLGLRASGEAIMTDVKASRPGKGVPVDTGTLRSSGTVSGPSGGKVKLTFGGPAAPYALAQHERMDYSHELGEARYLVRGWQRFEKKGAKVAQKAMIEQALATAFRNATFRPSSFDLSPRV